MFLLKPYPQPIFSKTNADRTDDIVSSTGGSQKLVENFNYHHPNSSDKNT